MRVSVSVRIDAEPGDPNNYGSMQFAEDATLSSAGFEVVSKVFTRMHELLAVIKHEHAELKRK